MSKIQTPLLRDCSHCHGRCQCSWELLGEAPGFRGLQALELHGSDDMQLPDIGAQAASVTQVRCCCRGARLLPPKVACLCFRPGAASAEEYGSGLR